MVKNLLTKIVRSMRREYVGFEFSTGYGVL
jgi:hypothetical protein